ncbi:MAG: hypothetical protein ACR2HD_05020, partial [Solirubrobacteraceae bacterium]
MAERPKRTASHTRVLVGERRRVKRNQMCKRRRELGLVLERRMARETEPSNPPGQRVRTPLRVGSQHEHRLAAR